METRETINAELKEMLSEKRYLHSIGVMKMAEKLANQYNIDQNIASLTGLTHDIAKEIPNGEKIKYAMNNNIKIDEIEMHNVRIVTC